MGKCNIGLIGLAVMGENLVLNMENHGFSVAVFNRTTTKVSDFIEGRAKGKNITGCFSIEELVNNLEKPRKVMMLVKAGNPVDQFIDLIIADYHGYVAFKKASKPPRKRKVKTADNPDRNSQ